MAVLGRVFHAKVHRCGCKCLRQGQNIGARPHIFPFGILQRLFKRCARFQPHPAGNARLPRAHYVDCACVLFRQVPAAHHGKTVERVEGIGKPVFADIFPVCGKVLSIPVHIRQNIHGIVLEHFIQFPQVWPALLVKPPVADAGHNEHASVCQHPFVPDYLCRKRLHHLNGVCPHPVPVVEFCRHAEHHHVIFLFRPVHIGAFIRRFPAHRLHLFCPARVDFNLAVLGIQHCITAEELFAHLLFHIHALLVELVAHFAAGAHGHKILPVHHLRHMVRRDAAPVRNAGGTVLIPA